MKIMRVFGRILIMVIAVVALVAALLPAAMQDAQQHQAPGTLPYAQSVPQALPDDNATYGTEHYGAAVSDALEAHWGEGSDQALLNGYIPHRPRAARWKNGCAVHTCFTATPAHWTSCLRRPRMYNGTRITSRTPTAPNTPTPHGSWVIQCWCACLQCRTHTRGSWIFIRI